MNKYIFTIHRAIDEKGNIIPETYYTSCSEAYREDGTKRLLHNEISVTFLVVDGSIYVLDGWHIGTQDYDLDEGDDETIEYYHPGLSEQILERLREMNK